MILSKLDRFAPVNNLLICPKWTKSRSPFLSKLDKLTAVDLSKMDKLKKKS